MNKKMTATKTTAHTTAPAPPPLPSAVYESVTPAMAEEWLAHNTTNRIVREVRVASYAATMKRGQWRLTHQGVAFGADGLLYDGQHRLLAVKTAGVPVTMLVVRGLPMVAREEIDTGTTRSGADNLTIVDGERTCAGEAAVLGCLYSYTALNQVRARVTVANLRETREKYRTAYEVMRVIFGSGRRGVGRAGYVAAFIFAHATAPEIVEKAARAFYTGADLSDGAPMFALRNHALGTARNKQPGIDDFRRALSAIAAEIDGDKRVRVTSRSSTPIEQCDAFVRFGRAHAK